MSLLPHIPKKITKIGHKDGCNITFQITEKKPKIVPKVIKTKTESPKIIQKTQLQPKIKPKITPKIKSNIQPTSQSKNESKIKPKIHDEEIYVRKFKIMGVPYLVGTKVPYIYCPKSKERLGIIKPNRDIEWY